MKKRKVLSVLIVILIFICLIITLSECKKTSLNSQKYISYRCFDYHLACLNIEGAKTKVEFSYYDDLTDFEYTQNAWIQKIAGESDDMFIYAEVMPSLPLGKSAKVVMQNPDKYVDVWSDWSVEKIELYYIDGHEPIDQDESANIPTDVISTTVDNSCLSDMKKIVDIVDEKKKLDIPEGYIRYNTDINGTGYNYYIRVYFNESENIVWDSNILIYYSSKSKDKIIYVDNGKEPSGIASVNSNDVNISAYKYLYDWIVRSIG